MERSRAVRLLHTIGVYWFAVALISLIGSTVLEATREFIASRHLLVYLGLYLVVLIPGFALLFIAQRLERGSGRGP